MYEQYLYNRLNELGLSQWVLQLQEILPFRNSIKFHGNFARWESVVSQLPEIQPSSIDLNDTCVRVGNRDDATPSEREALEKNLREFHPWRKGPFEVFGIYIDTEWRSDWKWDRLKEHISPLHGRSVLDIGCGSGYHCWRMRGCGADFVLGIDPTVVFVMQYRAIQHYIQDPAVQVHPLGIDDLPYGMHCFDTVFSMGLLYHRRDPMQHLQELRSYLKPHGELVLETLIIDEQYGDVLRSDGRYAQMRNVHMIPSVPTLQSWLEEAGFSQVRCVDVTPTTSAEQRVTDWMQFQSLSDFLDPNDPGKTIEGYPAPVRAILIARA